MQKTSRRQLLRKAGLASAAAALPLTTTADAQAKGTKVFHVFAFQWKPNATAADKQRAAKDTLAFQGVIPGLLAVNVGNNISSKGKGYTYAGVMQFADEASYKAYPTHPAHQALLKWLVPLIDPIELDFYA